VTALLVQRGIHNIEDELVFTNHDGYVFYDSRGFEAGDGEELKIVQDFVRRKSQEKRLTDRLHAIWFVLCGYLHLQIHKITLQVLHSDGQRSPIARCKVL
jgi:hypothetical protein